jgi:hypothetical protein
MVCLGNIRTNTLHKGAKDDDDDDNNNNYYYYYYFVSFLFFFLLSEISVVKNKQRNKRQ